MFAFVYAAGVTAVAGSIAAVIEQNDGAAVEPVQFPKTLFATAVERANVKAGVVVTVASETVKSGERSPDDTEVTVPEPPPPLPTGPVTG
jgi:hypothetical protein